jgi:uncharacterized protein (TIGR00645 family)
MNHHIRFVEAIDFASRFLIIPFLLGLIAGLAALIFKFGMKLYSFVPHISADESTEAIVGLVGLVDLTLTANIKALLAFLIPPHSRVPPLCGCRSEDD